MSPQHDYGLTSTQADALSVAGKTVSGALTGASAAASVPALLSAAGISATVPVAGWIVAAGIAAAAGTIALVTTLKRRAVSKDEAVAMAAKLGFSDAAAIPGFTLRAMEWSSDKRTRVAARLADRIARRAGTRRDWRSYKDKLKLSLLGVIEAVDLAEKNDVKVLRKNKGAAAAARLQARQRAELAAAAVQYGARQQQVIVGLSVLGVFGLIAIIVARSRRSK